MTISKGKTPYFIFRNEKKGWLVFDNPVEIVTSSNIKEIIPSLKKIDSLVRKGFWAAGYISYEAIPAFDIAGSAYSPDDFPLIYFGLFKKPKIQKEIIINEIEKKEKHNLKWEAELSEQKYLDSVARIKRYIEEGDVYQINFTFRMRCFFDINPLLYFVNIYNSHPVPYAVYSDLDKYVICSFSPELFFSIDKDKIISQPMKGTSKRGRDLKEDEILATLLMNNNKEKAENIMIVDIVRNDIGKIAKIGSVTVSELFSVKKFKTVLQMVSNVEGKTSASFDEIVKALFPPASVTGAPKIRATQIIKELEPSPRHLYCGTIGWYSPERKGIFNVAIRSVLINKEKRTAEFGTGSGIVWDSKGEKEYFECYLKTKIVTAPLQEMKLVETILWTKEEGYFLLELHLERAKQSAEYFSYPFNRKNTLLELEKISKNFTYERYRVRLTFDMYGKINIETSPILHQYSKEIKLFIIEEPIERNDIFLYHKTTNREQYEKHKKKIDGIPETSDLLFVNENGEITETTIANIVVEIDGEKYTPPVECGLLNGVFRWHLLTNGIIKEKILKLNDIKETTSLWRINSVRKWQRCNLIKS